MAKKKLQIKVSVQKLEDEVNRHGIGQSHSNPTCSCHPSSSRSLKTPKKQEK